jgi:hypothetical protein
MHECQHGITIGLEMWSGTVVAKPLSHRGGRCFPLHRFPYNKTNKIHQFLKFILELNSTCFGQFLCPSSGVIHCTHSDGICHTGLLRELEQQDQDGTAVKS